MIIVKLEGGMGNQLFQYALGKYLALKTDAKLKLDTDSYLNNKQRQYSLQYFSTEENFSTKKERKILKRKEYIRRKLKMIGFSISPYWYTERHPGYDNEIQQLKGSVYLEGFWQSEKYFKPIENIIRKEFVVNTVPAGINETLLQKIKTVNSVSVHVRRGDYISDPETNKLYGVCSVAYYERAMEYVSAKVKDPCFFVFSDDMEWTMANVQSLKHSIEYMGHNQDLPHEDLRLMYSCKHNILANSSFSWWGGWLNNHPGKIVIAPDRWNNIPGTESIVPDSWIRL